MTTGSSFALGDLRAGAVAILLLTAFWFRGAPLAPDPLRPASEPAGFQTERAIAALARILGDGAPHPVDSPQLDAVRERLTDEVRSLGYEPVVHDQTACRSSASGDLIRCARVRNITFRTGPETGPALVLAAHYDSVDASPGAGDDGIGLAVWLEVARQLRDAAPKKPVVFLFTDGEEAGLLGAQAFVDANAYGTVVERVVNLEARGVRGPALMFETSRPNSSIVTDWARVARRPVSNSMMTSVYERLPNSTDLTVFLRKGWDGVNLAISDGAGFYHTHRDDLTMLDLRSVQHMGDQALAVTLAFLAPHAPVRGDLAYTDILSRFFISIPQIAALAGLGLAFAVSGLMIVRPTRGKTGAPFDWTSFLLPPAVMMSSSLLALAGSVLLSSLRPEPAFWSGRPEALSLLIFLSVLVSATTGPALVRLKVNDEILFASGWFWFFLTGSTLSMLVPGAAILFVAPGMIFIPCAVLLHLTPRLRWLAHVSCLLAALVVFLPVHHLLEVSLGPTPGILFALLGSLILLPGLCLLTVDGRLAWMAPGAVILGWAGAFLAAWTGPAFTRDAPLGLNIVLHADQDTGLARIAASAPIDALPKALADALPDTDRPVGPDTVAPAASRSAAFPAGRSVKVETVSSVIEGTERLVTLRLSAPEARMIRVRIPGEARARGIRFSQTRDFFPISSTPGGRSVLDCVGVSCHGAELVVRLEGTAPPQDIFWNVSGYWSGLPDDAQRLTALRPDTSLPFGAGDVTVVSGRFRPDSGAASR